jgi:cell division protein FtsI/penicillin-binding protein 2
MLTSNDGVRVRIYIVVAVLLGLFAYVGVRLYFLQVARHDELYEKAKRKYTAVRTKTGKRGEIRDIDGHLLVGNVPVAQLVADPCNVETDIMAEKLALLLKSYFGLDPDETFKDLQRKTRQRKKEDGTEETVKRRYSLLVREVPFEEAAKFEHLLKVNGIRGVTFPEGYRRFYPKDHLMANVLGFLGGGGVETARQDTTRPETGQEKFEADLSGLRLPYGDGSQEHVRDGEHVYLTVSEPIQSIVEEELDKVMEKWKPLTAYAVMADPRTGNIMALAQRPTFNPNDRSKMTGDSWRVRAIEDSFEPGSVMKPMVVAGALDMGLVTPGMTIDCENGTWIYAGRSMRDTHPAKMVSVADIIKHSSNIGTAKIGLLLGKENLDRILRSFGLGSLTGIPLKPETRGQFMPVHKWDGLSITRFPIGYGVGVSPVQMVRAYCALADGGKLRKLRLVDRVEDPETGEIKNMPPEAPVSLYRNPAVANQIVDLMASVTRPDGTAFRAAIPGYEVAGKTGTSRKWVPEEKAYSYRKSYATFAGFVPARNPAFVLVVVVDEPKGSIYGGVVAAPAFKEIATRTLRFLDVKPDPALLPEDTARRSQNTTAAPARPTAPAVPARPATPRPAPQPPVAPTGSAPARPAAEQKKERKFVPLDSNYYRRGYQQDKPGSGR